MNQSSGLGVVTIDRAFTIQSWNQWLATATGLTEADARGRSLLSVVPTDRADAIRELLGEVISTGATRVLAPAFHRCLIACPPREPSRHFAEMQQLVTIAPLGSERQIVGALITVDDVTARLERERALTAEIESASTDSVPADVLEAVGAPDWRLRGAAVRALRQKASREEIAHLLDALQHGYHDFNVVSSALQVLVAAHRDVVSPLIDLLGDAQADVRMHAALALGKVGDHAAVPALVRALGDGDTNVRFHAIEALGDLGAAEAVEPLGDIARSGDFFLAFPAIAALAKADDPRVAVALTALLDNALLRPAVIDTLATVGDEDCVVPLAALLNGEAAEVGAVAAALDRIRQRYEQAFGAGAHIVDLTRGAMTPTGSARVAAAVSQRQAPLASLVTVLGWTGGVWIDTLVGALGEPDVEVPLSEAIVAIGRDAVVPLIARLAEGDRNAKHAAVSLLGTLGDRRAVPALIAVLDGADAELAAAAAAALARLGDAAALDPLLELFAHPQAIVRQAALGAVNSLGADGTRARILARLGNEDARVRASVIRVAGYFGFGECVPAIFRALADPDEDVRRAAIEQLPVVDDPAAVPRLVEALRTDTPRNRAAAAHALRDMSGHEVTGPLLEALEDRDPWVRYFVAGSVGGLRVLHAVPALSQMARVDEAPYVRIAAIQALAAIDADVASTEALTLVNDADRDVACAALVAIASGTAGSTHDDIEAALRSTDGSLRRGAVQAFGLRPDVRSVESLAWAARMDDPADLSSLAVESLGRIASSDQTAAGAAAMDALLDLGTVSTLRELTIATIARLPPAATDHLAAALSSPRNATRLTAVEALARMQQSRASQVLEMALEDREPAVRRAAVAAFGRLGTSAVGRRIAALSRRDPDAGVRRLAAAVCRRHGWTQSRGEAP